jgi:hypothetical protein
MFQNPCLPRFFTSVASAGLDRMVVVGVLWYSFGVPLPGISLFLTHNWYHYAVWDIYIYGHIYCGVHQHSVGIHCSCH